MTKGRWKEVQTVGGDFVRWDDEALELGEVRKEAVKRGVARRRRRRVKWGVGE